MIRNKGGSVINFSTIAVPLGLKGESIYSASKAGLVGLTKSLSKGSLKHLFMIFLIISQITQKFSKFTIGNLKKKFYMLFRICTNGCCLIKKY